MTDADQIVRNCKKALANRGRPHMTELTTEIATAQKKRPGLPGRFHIRKLVQNRD
jgi:hypothetical protein